MKNIGTFLFAGAIAGVAVWFFNTPKGRAFLDGTLKDISNQLAGDLKTKLHQVKKQADNVFDDGEVLIDEMNVTVQDA